MGWTKGTLFASLPEDAQGGDKIALYKGGKVPIVLRSRGSELFEMVGDAYVYSVMFGEAWDGNRCRDLTLI